MTTPDQRDAGAASFQVQRITAVETIEVRWPVLRAGLERDTAIFPGDELESTRHWGAFEPGGRMIGVVSIYRVERLDVLALAPECAGRCWQLRGMGVVPEWQGRSVGRALVHACLQEVRQEDGAKAVIWCNARSPAVAFYRKEGFVTLGEEFTIPTAGPHFVMWRRV